MILGVPLFDLEVDLWFGMQCHWSGFQKNSNFSPEKERVLLVAQLCD